MVRTLEFKRIRWDDLPQHEAAGWTPAVVHGGAVGVHAYAGGSQLAVLVRREVKPGAQPSGLALRRPRRSR